MKKLFLIRHAKSSWQETDLKDFDRPLNQRGLRDAPLMGKLLRKKGIKPDLILTSSANRAFTTAKIIAEEIDYPINSIIDEKEIYEADALDLMEIIRNIDDEADSIFLFGHNPSLTYLSNHLSNQRIENIPTCGISEIEFQIDSWRELKPESGNMVNFEYPKKYLKK